MHYAVFSHVCGIFNNIVYLLIGAGALLFPATAAAASTPPDTLAAVSQDHLHLSINAANITEGHFEGTARYRLTTGGSEVKQLVFSASKLSVEAVEIAFPDTVYTVSHETTGGDSLVVGFENPLPADSSFELTVAYQGSPGPGLRIDRRPDKSLNAIWTSGIPGTNRFWFPTLERPDDRLTSELVVTLPSPLRLVTGGQQVPANAADEEVATYHYRNTTAHPTYLIGFAGGTYENLRSAANVSDTHRVLLDYLVPPEQIGNARLTFGPTKEVIQFLSDTLAFPYPWPAYRQATVPDIRPIGLTLPMLALPPDSMIVNHRVAQHQKTTLPIARTLARQWTGSLIPLKHWTDAWITEGLSNYLALSYLHQQAGRDTFLWKLQQDEKQIVSKPLQQAVVLTASDTSSLPSAAWFAPERARKGAWVFHMLRATIGDQPFHTVLRRLVAAPADSSITTEALQQLFEQAANRSLQPFFDQWVYAKGYPQLELSYAFNPSVDSLSVQVKQQQTGPGVPQAFSFDLPITIHTLAEQQEFVLPIRTRNELFAVAIEEKPRFVEVDPENTVLDSSEVKQPAAAWIRQLRTGTTLTSRLQAAKAAAAFTNEPALMIGLQGTFKASSNPLVQAAIVHAFGRLPASSTVTNFLSDASRAEQPALRQAALIGLRNSQEVNRARRIALQAAQNDRSYNVQAEAVRTLAHLGGDQAFDMVESAFVTSSYNEVIRRAAFDALAILDLPLAKELPLALQWSAPDVPAAVRAAAPAYLVNHLDNQQVRNRMEALLEDPTLLVQQAAAQALQDDPSTEAQTLANQQLQEEDNPWIWYLLSGSTTD